MEKSIQIAVSSGVIRIIMNEQELITVDPIEFVMGCEQARLRNVKTGQTASASFREKAPRGLMVA